MERLKKGLRVIVILILLVLAFCGIGITGDFLNPKKERNTDNKIKTEKTLKRRSRRKTT